MGSTRPIRDLVSKCLWLSKVSCWTASGTEGKCLIVWMWFFSFDFSLHLGLQEELARATNLQPAQVYNWFANYRRRQKSHLVGVEKLNNSCPERALASHRSEPQHKGSNTPQTAGGSHVDVSPGQTEITHMPCEPGWEQSAAPPYKPPERTYLKMLESSCMQSPELYEAGTSMALFTPQSSEQLVPFGTEAVMEAGTCFGSPVLLPGEAVSRAAASPWQGSYVLCSYQSFPSVKHCLPMWWAPCSTGGVSGSMWIPGVEVPLRLCLATLSAHLFLHPVWKEAKPWDKARSWRVLLLTRLPTTYSRQHACSVSFLNVDGCELPADTLHVPAAVPQEIPHCFLFPPFF